MQLPFSRRDFIEVFGAYNEAVWPIEIAFWVGTVAVLIALHSGRRWDRLLNGILAAQWLWSGLIYHAFFFTRINPAAAFFACLFIIQGGLFIIACYQDRLTYRLELSRGWSLIGISLVVYAMAYPAIALVSDLEFPKMPLSACLAQQRY
jgi:Family of unknown function (DUF6064)